MRFTYDNSTNNLRNPNQPPKAVSYGPQSSDEMAELWFQLLPRDHAELELLSRDYQTKVVQVMVEYDRARVRKDPNDAEAHTELGMLLLCLENVNEAEQHLRKAIRSAPHYQPAHYNLGIFFRTQGQLTEALVQFQEALRLDPNDYQTYGNLGFIFMKQGNWREAEKHLQAALKINPDDPLLRDALKEMMRNF